MEDAHVAMLLEDLRGQFKVFGEALQGTHDELHATRDELGGKIDRLSTRMTQVERHLRLNGAATATPPKGRKPRK